jgi:hypothetical protein
MAGGEFGIAPRLTVALWNNPVLPEEEKVRTILIRRIEDQSYH